MSSIKISEIKKYDSYDVFGKIVESGKIYGIEIDEPTFSAPEWVKEIGILLKVDDGVFNDDVLDAAISYSLKNINVIIEVPFGAEIDNEYLVNVAANAGFSLSYLPPHDKKDLDAYIEQVKEITDLYLKRQFFKEVLPVSSYMNYLFYETYNGKEAASSFVVDDYYIVNKFVSLMSTEDSDKMKAEMRKVIMEHFGGEETFKAIAFYIRKNIQERVIGTLESVKKDLEEEKTEEGHAKD